MKLDDAQIVANMARVRRHLIDQRDGWRMSVTLAGPASSEVLDPHLTAQLRPLVNAELDRRIAVLEGDLRALGVEVD